VAQQYPTARSGKLRAAAFTFHSASGSDTMIIGHPWEGRIMNITDKSIQEMREYLGGIEEPRRTAYGNFRHKLTDIIVIAFTATLCGSDEFEEMEEFGRLKQDFFKEFLELPNGIPDESTFRKVINRLDPIQLHKSMDNWLIEVAERQKSDGDTIRAVNVDGKTIRGSKKEGRNGLHVVSAWVGENNLTLGELATGEKSNEITAVPELLDMLDIKGDVVTADAMSCQTDIAKKIRKKEADYILAVKKNQPTLYDNIKTYFDGMERGEIRDIPEDVWQSELKKGHGRLEKREVRIVTDIDWLENKEAWPDLKTIIQYRTYRTIIGCETVMTDQYFISSAVFFAEEFGKYIRGHWSIENNLHWCLDVIFREDERRARTGNAALNLNIMRKLALKRLRSLKVEKKRYSAKLRMLRAVLDDSFLSRALFGK
jgi:predicted transposase YbfD/YdcC